MKTEQIIHFKPFKGELNFFTVLSLLLFVLFLSSYFLPFVPKLLTEYLSNSLGDIVFLSLVTISSFSTINLSQDEDTLRFWFTFQISMVIWWLTYLCSFIFPDSGQDLPGSVLYDGSNYVVYLLLIMMVEFHREDSDSHSTASNLKFWYIGLSINSLLFMIFILIQALYFPENYSSWYPSLLYYAFMDIYIIYRFFNRFIHSSISYWKGVYFWFSMAALGWAISDISELILQGDIDFWTHVSRTDSLWWIPFLFLVFAATRSPDY